MLAEQKEDGLLQTERCKRKSRETMNKQTTQLAYLQRSLRIKTALAEQTKCIIIIIMERKMKLFKGDQANNRTCHMRGATLPRDLTCLETRRHLCLFSSGGSSGRQANLKLNVWAGLIKLNEAVRSTDICC